MPLPNGKINEVVERMIVTDIESKKVKHISIFALARIPLLVHLGNALGDKVAADLYQHHRDDPVGWKWRQGESVDFVTNLLQEGTDKKKVALIISLSGKIDITTLPDHIDSSYFIYEIAPVGKEPSRSLLLAKETLDAFQRT